MITLILSGIMYSVLGVLFCHIRLATSTQLVMFQILNVSLSQHSLCQTDTTINYVPYRIDSNYSMMILTPLLSLKEQEKENILCSTYT